MITRKSLQKRGEVECMTREDLEEERKPERKAERSSIPKNNLIQDIGKQGWKRPQGGHLLQPPGHGRIIPIKPSQSSDCLTCS